jgi:hypothetical protein
VAGDRVRIGKIAYLGVEADHLVVTATVTALADHTLGDTVHRRELDIVELALAVLRAGLQVAETLLEAVEFTLEDVGLVDFVGEHDKVLLGRKLDDRLDGLGLEGGAGRVTRVDDSDGADVDAFLLGLVESLTDAGHVGAPSILLVQVVGNALGVEQAESGGVERVLRDRDEDTGVGRGADDSQEGVDTSTGTGGEVDVGRVGRVAVASLDEVGNGLPDTKRTLRLRVCADRLDVLEQGPGALNDILLVAQALLQNVLVLQQLRVLHQTEDLAEEGDGLLVELLRVADVGCDDSVEGQVLALALGQSSLELLRANGEFATDGIFCLFDVRVDVVDVQALGPGRGLGEHPLGDEVGNGQRTHGTGKTHVGRGGEAACGNAAGQTRAGSCQ